MDTSAVFLESILGSLTRAGERNGVIYAHFKIILSLTSALGGIIYLNVLGKSMIVINDLKVARDLMDKRGSIYSDRPRLVLFCEM